MDLSTAARPLYLAVALSALGCAPSPEAAAPAATVTNAPTAAVARPANAEAPAASAEPPALRAEATEAAALQAQAEDADALHAAGVRHERQRQLSEAVTRYTRACDLGSARSCNRAGEMLRDGHGVAPDEARARQLFEQACEHGSTAACDALGH